MADTQPKEPSVWYKGALLAMVFGPFVALFIALRQLWNRQVGWKEVYLLAGTYIPVMFGVTIGFHRWATHRAFKPHPVVKFFLILFGLCSVEGTTVQWAETHLQHHDKADKEGDPHSPYGDEEHPFREFVWAHVGWVLHWLFGRGPAPTRLSRHLRNDPMVTFMDRLFPLWIFLSLVGVPYLLGGKKGIVWGGIVRMFLVHHVTWSVNSVCHVFGSRPFNTDDQARNNLVVGILAGGEGWHNNHHAFQRAAIQGFEWWQFDLSGYLITLLEWLGLVRDVQRVTPEEKENYNRRRLRRIAA